MKFTIVPVTALTLLVAGNPLCSFGQTIIYEQSRYGNNSTGVDNPDFVYGSGLSATKASPKSTAPGLPGGSSSTRFFPPPGGLTETFTLTPSGTNALTVGQTYAVAITFPHNSTANQDESGNVVVTLSDAGTTGTDTFVGTSAAFATNCTPVNTWASIGQVTIGSASPSFTFTWASGMAANARWYVDTVRFIPVPTMATAEYWDTGTIGGSGTWDSSSLNWNPNADGSGTPATYNSAGLAVFGGTPGTVTIDPGGVTADGGVEFDATGYTVQGGTLTLGATPYLWVSNSAALTINAPIAGVNGMVLPATGTLNLGAPVTGLTGTVNLVGGGALNLKAGGSQSFSSLTGAGPLNIGTATLTVGGDNTSTTYAGILSDGGAGSPGALVKTGTGILTLTGASTYAGTTTVGNGQLSITAENGLGATPAAFDAAHLVINDGTVFASAKTSGTLTLSANRGITLNGSATVVAMSTGAREITLNCPITGSGSLTMPGVWPDFNATNTFAGDLIFAQTNNCSIRFNTNNSAGLGRIHIMPLTVSGTPNTIRNFAPTGISTTITNDIFYDESVSPAQNYNIDTAGAAGAFILSGNITGMATGGVNVNDNPNGGGTVTLSGDNSGFSGGFNLEGGTLVLGSATALGSGLFVVNNVGFATQVLQATVPLTGASAITNTVYLNSNGLTLSGSNPFEFAGPFHLGAGPSTSLDIETPTTISGNVDDQGLGRGLTLTSATSSTLLLKGTNSYTGGTTLNSGTLEAAVANSIAGDVTVFNGTLQLDDAQAMPPGSTLTYYGGTINLSFTGYQTNASFVVMGTPQAPGVYNASSPGLSGYVTGTGNIVVVTNFNIVSEAFDQTGTNYVVCWQSGPGHQYDVLTNGDLTVPAGWMAANPSPITAVSSTTCLTLPGGPGASTNLFVRVRKNF